MKIAECLKVLSAIEPDKRLNMKKLCRKTSYPAAKVKKALHFLSSNAIISGNGGKVKIYVKKLN